VLSCGHGVEALILAILDGDHALYKVGRRLEERGMVALLLQGLTWASLHDYRLGRILAALFAANLNSVLSAVTLKALEVYAMPTTWLHQGTTTMRFLSRYSSSAEWRSRWRNFVINSRGSAVRYASVNDAMPRSMACSRGRRAHSWSKAFCKRTAVGPACRMAWVHRSTA